jgi:hypothetical protein
MPVLATAARKWPSAPQPRSMTWSATAPVRTGQTRSLLRVRPNTI